MKTLQLNAWDRLMLTQCLPTTGTLERVAVYLRLIEILRLKEDERKAVGLVEDLDRGSVTIKDVTTESPITFEDADFEALRVCVAAWAHWPTLPQTLTLKEKMECTS